MDTTTPAPASKRAVTRVRHALKLRELTVRQVRRLSPHVVSVNFGGDALADFVSASFDDHVKLMLPPRPGAALALPTPTPDGPVFPEGAERPVMRDYTPRHFDPAARTLEIEFALHGPGPAAAWAAQAEPGQRVGIGGPRGSFVIPSDYDWHLLAGDESALPAIARRLQELPAGARAFVLIETADAADRRELATRAAVEMQWITAGALVDAVRALKLPAGEGYAWAAGEAATTAALRRVLVETHGLDKDHIRAAAYWKGGAVAHHENL